MLLLRAVASAGPDDSTAARLGQACGLNRATAWRILHTLELHDVVSCDRETGRWSVGRAVVDLAQSAGAETLLTEMSNEDLMSLVSLDLSRATVEG